MEVYKFNKSSDLFQRALKCTPSGVQGHLGPVNGCFIPIEAFPLFSSHAKGSYFWDVDGNRFIDYMCAYGPNVLGYNDEEVNEATRKQMELGDCTTLPGEKMVEFAELLTNTIEMADWTFFAKNGGDVTNLALIIARAATGRRKVVLIKGGYHGVAQWTQKLGYLGITAEDVKNNLYIEWNNFEQFKKVVDENPDDIACFMATPYHHPVFEDNVLPDKEYWQKVRKLCTEKGIVLAIDDVRCGFRLDMKGSDHYFGFKADLSCYCKALANGLNVSALCGIDALKNAASEVMYTGSYWLSSVPFAAGIACINKLKRIDGPKLMIEKGKKITEGLKKLGKSNGFDLSISGIPSMWYMRITNDDSLSLHQEWIAECVKRGAFFANHHNLFVNCALSEEDIKLTLDIADEAFKVVKKKHPEI